MSDVKLLPCPFCGKSDTTLIGWASVKAGSICIKCLHCKMLTSDFSTPEEAITFWNTRAQTPLQRWAPGSDAPQGLYRYWDNVNEVWSALFLHVLDTGKRMLVLIGVDGLFDWTDETLYGPIPAPDVDAVEV